MFKVQCSTFDLNDHWLPLGSSTNSSTRHGKFHKPKRPSSIAGRDTLDLVLILRAFTLLELLVVLAIIGVLIGLLLPVMSRAKEAARSTTCLSSLHQIGIALQLYVQDNENRLPIMRDRLVETNSFLSTNSTSATSVFATIDLVLSNYLGAPKVLRCPSDKQKLFEQTASSYAWNNLLNGQDADHLKVFNVDFNPHQIPVVLDKEAFHRARGEKKGVNYLYADGHIKNLLVLEGTK